MSSVVSIFGLFTSGCLLAVGASQGTGRDDRTGAAFISVGSILLAAMVLHVGCRVRCYAQYRPHADVAFPEPPELTRAQEADAGLAREVTAAEEVLAEVERTQREPYIARVLQSVGLPSHLARYAAREIHEHESDEPGENA